jgi:hypothetical protein
MRHLKLLFVFTLFISCKDELKVQATPPPVSDSLLIEIMTEMHLVDALSKQRVIEDNRKLDIKYGQYKYILEKHGVSHADFDTSLVYFSKHPDLFKEIYDSIIVKFKQMEIETYSQAPIDSLE